MSLSEPSMPDTTPSYGITPQGYSRALRLQVIISLAGWGVMMLIMLGLFAYLMNSSDLAENGLVMALAFVVPLTLFATAVAGGAGAFRYVMLKRQLGKYRVWLSEDTITITGQGVNPISVRREDVTDLAESKRYGMMIWTRNPYSVPFVNPYVENYEQIRATLIGWHPLSDRKMGFGWLRFRAPLTVVCLLILFFVPNYFVIFAAWLAVVGINGYAMYFITKVPEINTTTRATSLGSQVLMIVLGSLAALAAVLRLASAGRGIP